MAPVLHSREEIAGMLREHGVTPTHQRMEIAQALFQRREHLSADQILSMVNSRHAETSKATVYNTLRLFLEKKLIRELIVDPARIVYDPNTTLHHHRQIVLESRGLGIGHIVGKERLPVLIHLHPRRRQPQPVTTHGSRHPT